MPIATVPGVPEQPNGDDCGLYMLKLIELIARYPHIIAGLTLLGFDRDGSQSILILFRELPPLGVNFRWTDHTSLKFEQTDIAELRSQMLHAIRSLQAAQQSRAAC